MPLYLQGRHIIIRDSGHLSWTILFYFSLHLCIQTGLFLFSSYLFTLRLLVTSPLLNILHTYKLQKQFLSYTILPFLTLCANFLELLGLPSRGAAFRLTLRSLPWAIAKRESGD